MMTWHLEKRKISSLIPHPKNPRMLSDHDSIHLQKSLEKFGMIDKPVITKDGNIIGGHQRLEIFKKMGKEEVECYVPDHELTDKDIDELNIRLNKNNGEWNYEILANEWEADYLMEWGFDAKDLGIDSIKHIEELQEEESKNQKTKKTCPNCGHEL